MPDPLKRLQSGDPLPTSQRTWNAMLDAAKAELQRRNEGGLAAPLEQGRNSSIVRVLNDSGVDLHRRSVLGLAGPVFGPAVSEDAFLREVAFRGVTPQDEHRGRFGILLEPAPAGRVVRAIVAGVTQVKINVLDSSDRAADVEAGVLTELASDPTGAAQIIWREGDDDSEFDTGEQWAIIRFGGGGSTGVVAKIAKTGPSGIPAMVGLTPGSGTVEIYDFTTGSLTDSGHADTARNVSNDAVAPNTIVVLLKVDGKWVVILEPCPAAYYY